MVQPAMTIQQRLAMAELAQEKLAHDRYIIRNRAEAMKDSRAIANDNQVLVERLRAAMFAGEG